MTVKMRIVKTQLITQQRLTNFRNLYWRWYLDVFRYFFFCDRSYHLDVNCIPECRKRRVKRGLQHW